MSDILGVGADPNTGNTSGIKMNSLPANLEAFYLQRLTAWGDAVARITILYDSLISSTLDEYNLGSGDGRVMGKRKSLEKVGAELQTATERYTFFYHKLYGRNLMTVRMRRK